MQTLLLLIKASQHLQRKKTLICHHAVSPLRNLHVIEHRMFVLGRANFVEILTVFFIDLTYRPVMNMEWIKQSVVVCD